MMKYGYGVLIAAIAVTSVQAVPERSALRKYGEPVVAGTILAAAAANIAHLVWRHEKNKKKRVRLALPGVVQKMSAEEKAIFALRVLASTVAVAGAGVWGVKRYRPAGPVTPQASPLSTVSSGTSSVATGSSPLGGPLRSISADTSRSGAVHGSTADPSRVVQEAIDRRVALALQAQEDAGRVGGFLGRSVGQATYQPSREETDLQAALRASQVTYRQGVAARQADVNAEVTLLLTERERAYGELKNAYTLLNDALREGRTGAEIERLERSRRAAQGEAERAAQPPLISNNRSEEFKKLESECGNLLEENVRLRNAYRPAPAAVVVTPSPRTREQVLVSSDDIQLRELQGLPEWLKESALEAYGMYQSILQGTMGREKIGEFASLFGYLIQFKKNNEAHSQLLQGIDAISNPREKGRQQRRADENRAKLAAFYAQIRDFAAGLGVDLPNNFQ